jgi:hypothetical protein
MPPPITLWTPSSAARHGQRRQPAAQRTRTRRRPACQPASQTVRHIKRSTTAQMHRYTNASASRLLRAGNNGRSLSVAMKSPHWRPGLGPVFGRLKSPLLACRIQEERLCAATVPVSARYRSPHRGLVVKNARERMDILAAYRQVGSSRREGGARMPSDIRDTPAGTGPDIQSRAGPIMRVASAAQTR